MAHGIACLSTFLIDFHSLFVLFHPHFFQFFASLAIFCCSCHRLSSRNFGMALCSVFGFYAFSFSCNKNELTIKFLQPTCLRKLRWRVALWCLLVHVSNGVYGWECLRISAIMYMYELNVKKLCLKIITIFSIKVKKITTNEANCFAHRKLL